MGLIEDYGLDSRSKALLLLLFHVSGKGDTRLNKIQINKMIRYFQLLSKKNEISFSQYNLGDVSFEIQEGIDELLDIGILEEDRSKLFLSEEGKKASEELSKKSNKKDIELLSKSYNTLNGLSDEEIMFFMYNEIPESRINSKVYGDLMKRGVRLVQNLYNKGKISASTALSWVSEEDRDKLELEVRPEYLDYLESNRSKKTVSAVNPSLNCR